MTGHDSSPINDGRRVAVRVTRGAERHLRSGHPWLFDRSITSVSHDGEAGDVAVVFDHDRKFLAVGLYDPDSPIRVRVLAAREPATIDDEWFAGALDRAAARRMPLLEREPAPTGYRLVHGENDGLGGLVVDRYRSALVVKVYTAAWFPHLRTVIGALVAQEQPDAVVLRLARSVSEVGEWRDGAVVWGSLPADTSFAENGLSFGVDPIGGQKTGYFLDQRDNRRRVRDLVAEDGARRVLDVFSCAGGFAAHAAAGGAAKVTTIDVSPHAGVAAAANFARNQFDPAILTTRTGDAFAELSGLADAGRQFDVVVVDPPSFTSRLSGVDRARASYRRLARLASGLVAPSGRLVQASCSSRVGSDDLVAEVTAGVSEAGRRLAIDMVTGQPDDHPLGFAQGAYLNAVFGRLD